MNDYSKPFRFETKEEQKEREKRELPINAFNAVTEQCYFGHAMRQALSEDPAACEAFLRIAERTQQIRNAALALVKKEEPRRGE